MIYINRLITKTLIAIIIILLCLIFSNFSDSFKKSYDKYYKNNNIRFNKGLKIYEKVIGKPIFLKEEGLSSQVIELSNNYELEKYLDGNRLKYQNNALIHAFNSGIVVFVGNKENYLNTVIIQGIDGVDVWYGNITDISVSLYDYVEKDKVIGTPLNNELLLKIEKDGQVINFNDYINEI